MNHPAGNTCETSRAPASNQFIIERPPDSIACRSTLSFVLAMQSTMLCYSNTEFIANHTAVSARPTRRVGSSVTLVQQISSLLPTLPFPSLPLLLLFPLFPFPLLPLPSLYPFPPVRSRLPLIQLRGLGERSKLPQRGLGQSPSGNQFWCILALKFDIWRHQIY